MIDTILNFWFKETDHSQWFKKDSGFDELIRERFMNIHRQAKSCELYHWRVTPSGRLAEIIILDQFSRNMFRGQKEAFENDQLALVLAQEAVAQGDDTRVPPVQKSFFYLPYMHSESIIIHRAAEKLYRQPGLESNLEWELKHKEIIDRFGRYPHRNSILGRESTDKELAFLQQPGSGF